MSTMDGDVAGSSEVIRPAATSLTIRACGVLALGAAGLCNPAARPQPQAEPGCHENRAPVLAAHVAERRLHPGGEKARFLLTLSGSSPSHAQAELCVYVRQQLVYYDRWDALWWWNGPGADTTSNPDSLVLGLARQFFASDAFATFAPEWADEDWFGEPDMSTPDAVAHSLKEWAYRTRAGISPSTALPAHVRDSIRFAPTDTAAVRAVVHAMAAASVTIFKYWAGGENVVFIGWSPGAGRFLRLMCSRCSI